MSPSIPTPLNLAPLKFSSLEPLLALKLCSSLHVDLPLYLSIFHCFFSLFLPSLFPFLCEFVCGGVPLTDGGGGDRAFKAPRYAQEPLTFSSSDDESLEMYSLLLYLSPDPDPAVDFLGLGDVFSFLDFFSFFSFFTFGAL